MDEYNLNGSRARSRACVPGIFTKTRQDKSRPVYASRRMPCCLCFVLGLAVSCAVAVVIVQAVIAHAVAVPVLAYADLISSLSCYNYYY